MKKIFLVVLILIALLMSFSGCGTESQNTYPGEQTKLIKFDSTPQGAELFVDNQDTGQTPIEFKLPFGTHNILIRKNGFEDYYGSIDVANDGKEQVVSITLNKELLRGGEIIRFIDKPTIYTFGGTLNLTYSGIYLNDSVEINGYTVLNSFDIVFPSGKTVHFDTESTGYKDAYGKEIRKFSKTVIFDEIGEYKIFSDNKIVTTTSGGYAEYKFKVLYKAKILTETTLGSLSGNPKDDNVVLLPVGEALTLKLLLTDANGKIARNKPIGLNNLKTDDNGVVSIKVESNGIDESPFVVYGDVLCYACEYTTFDTSGNFIKSCFMKANQKGELVQSIPPNVPQKVSIINEDGHIYMSFDCSGLSLNDLGFKGNLKWLFIHPKNPLVIYTNSSVSKDGGKSFENFGDGLSLDTIAIDPNHPEVVYGFLNANPFMSSGLMKSTDYVMHFTKIADFKIVESIVVDPRNSKIIYVTTDKGLLKTTDGGKTWETFFSCHATPWINPHNTNVIFAVGCGFAGSKDSGKTWDNLNFFKDRPQEWNIPIEFVFDPIDSNVVYAITYSHLFKSEDNGNNWTMPTSRYFFDLWNIAIDPVNPQKIYLGCNDGILESDDGGINFKAISNPSPNPNSNFNAYVYVNSKGEVFSILCGIPFKMTQSGNWLPLNDAFLKDGPDWKIIDGEFYVDVKTIKSDTAAVEITNDRITFYRLLYMGP
jgi:hypothetical protein